MKQDLQARLRGAAPVAAIIADRVHWVRSPQGTALPRVTLLMIEPGIHDTHAGTDALRGPLVQIDIWGNGSLEVERAAHAIIATLTPAADVGETRFRRAFIEGQRDGGDQIDTKFIYRTSLDMRVWHTVIS